MKNPKKIIALLLCAVLLVAGSVAGTLAYLTSRDTVVNTFTVGKVEIKLDEAAVQENGEYVSGHDNRVKTNKYHLLPGHSYIKDPTVTVLANSDKAYIRMKVNVFTMDALKSAMPIDKFPTYYNGDVFLLQNLVTGWNSELWQFESYTADGDNGVYEFRYFAPVDTMDGQDLVLDDLFETIEMPETLDNTAIANLAGVQITVTADAIQADGFADAAAAWNAFDVQQDAANS